MKIAQTIVQQIKTLDPRAFMAWGAKEFISMGDGLKFKTSGLTPWKGYVYIRYNPGKDLYEIDFFRFRKMEVKYDRKVADVYAEDLVSTIDGFVG